METPLAPQPNNQNLKRFDKRELYRDSKTGIETLLSYDEGYIVGRINNELLRYKTDAHLITISPTGGGKTTGSIIPNLLDHPGSAFVIDIRGETVAKTANAKRLMGHRVVVLDPYNLTKKQWGVDSYNFFDRITGFVNNIDIDDRIQRIVSALMFDPSGRMSNEPIWDNATKNLLAGLISYVVKYLPKENHNLIKVLDILNYSSSELEWFIAELTTMAENDSKAGKDRILKSLIKILTDGKSKTKITDNAFIQAQTLLSWVGNKSFENVLEFSTFSFEELQKSKMTVYLVVPEEYIDSSASWVRLLIESAVFSVNDIYNSKGMNTTDLFQSDRVLFMLDELPAFGQLDIVSKGMATLRGRGISLWLFLQNISQLDDIYGENKAKTIIGNAAAIQLFQSNELHELEYFSKLIGEEFYDVQSVTIGETQTSGQSIAKGTSHTIGNSESVTLTKGTSDSLSEATSSNWSKAFSKSLNKNITKNKSTTKAKGSSESRNKGSNDGENKTINRNGLQGMQQSDSNSSGTSKGKQAGTSFNKSDTSGIAYSQGEARSETDTEGGGKTQTKTHTSNESQAYGETKSFSDTTSETITNNESVSTNQNITVKQERMKIETVRSLKEKLSNRNQLLLVRGYQPFFVPKMSYFVKFVDANKYMFPEMLAAIEPSFFSELLDRNLFNSHTLALKLKETKSDAIENIIEEIDQCIDNTSHTHFNTEMEIIDKIKDLITDTINSKIKSSKEVLNNLDTRFDEFNYITFAIIGFLETLKNHSSFPYFKNMHDELLILIEALEEQKSQPISLEPKANQYQTLPILQIENGIDKSIGKNGYNISNSDAHWLIETYRPVVVELINDLKNEDLNISKLIENQNKFKQWLEKLNNEFENNYSNLISFIVSEEISDRQNFFNKYTN